MRRERLATAAVAAGLAGCEGRQSALAPAGAHAERLFELTVALTVGAAVIFVAVMALVLTAVLARPGPQHQIERDPRRFRWVSAAVGVTVVVLAAVLLQSLWVSRALTASHPDALRIDVSARQFWWDVHYPAEPPSRRVRTANELRLPVGRPVEIHITSRDVIHSVWIPNLQGKMDAIPGRTNILRLQADRPGQWRGQCAEFCGLQHAKMAFDVIALPPADFEAWREAQLLPAAPPADPLAVRGQEVFLSRGCVLCHTVRGTRAMASAGPDLTHLASRLSLAAGTLPNTRGNLGGWILDPQHIKPGNQMPPNALDPDSLHALLHYLESLR